MKIGTMRYSTINLGDDIQTLSAMNYLRDVQGTFDRDNSNAFDGNSKCFVICNGWWMNPVEGIYNFPLNRQIVPFFVSVHLDERFRTKFTNEMAEYMRRLSPIGCRDESTQKFLETIGVPCFFSGCLTMTLGLFPETRRPQSRRVLVVDVPAWVQRAAPDDIMKRAQFFSHRYVRPLKPANVYAEHEARLDYARNLLEEYRQASLVLTGRLHCALPCLAFGTPVVLAPENPNDPRFGAIAPFLPVYREGDKINWNPKREPIPDLARALCRLVTTAVEMQNNPLKFDKTFPIDFL